MVKILYIYLFYFFMNQMFDSLELSALLISIIAGILIGIPTGPARFFVVDTCLNDGKKAALKVYGGLFTAILFYACLAIFASDLISRNQTIESIFYLLASILLVVWGVVISLKSNQNSNTSIQLNLGSWFKKGFVVGISNPVTPFIYLTFIQLVKVYSSKPSLFNNILFILVFEFFSFLTISLIALLLLHKRDIVLNNWKRVKLIMGIFLICLGTYHTFQQLDFSNGIEIKSSQNLLEKQVDNKQTER